MGLGSGTDKSQIPQPVKFTARFSRWSFQEIEAFEHVALAARG